MLNCFVRPRQVEPGTACPGLAEINKMWFSVGYSEIGSRDEVLKSFHTSGETECIG